jgi:hypothetical protein
VSAGAQTAIAGYPVELAGRLGLRRLAYGAPDPFLNPFQTRIDTIFDAGLSLTVPIYNGVKGSCNTPFIGTVRRTSFTPITTTRSLSDRPPLG